ncbi:MAG: hypothetical protein AAFY20_19510 [Cyanobacteria bacterium J06639_14]
MYWFWEIKQTGSGPHYYLLLDFEPTATKLAAVVRPLLTNYDYRDGVWTHRDSGQWAHTTVAMAANRLEITRGWGHDTLEDDDFIDALMASPLKLSQWQIMAGGEGYATRSFRSGNDVASFLDYLKLSSAP